MIRAVLLGIVISLVLAGGFFAYGKLHSHPGADQKKSAQEYVALTLPLLAQKWDVQELKTRATPDLKMSPGKTPDSAFGEYRALGTLISAEPATCNVYPSAVRVLALCDAAAKFTGGDRHLSISLENRQADWKIASFDLVQIPTTTAR